MVYLSSIYRLVIFYLSSIYRLSIVYLSSIYLLSIVYLSWIFRLSIFDLYVPDDLGTEGLESVARELPSRLEGPDHPHQLVLIHVVQTVSYRLAHLGTCGRGGLFRDEASDEDAASETLSSCFC